MFLNIRNKKIGFSSVEILLAGSVMGLVLVSLLGFLFYASDSIKGDNISSRSSFVAKEGLEAVSSIRDRGFVNLVDGVYGLSFTSGQWDFSGASDQVGDFNRAVTISTVSENVKKATVLVTWPKSPGRSGSLFLSKYFTNWQEQGGGVVLTQAEQLIVDTSGLLINNNQVNGTLLSNSGPDETITIDSIELIWMGVNSNTRINSIVIGGTTVWSGSGTSGSTFYLSTPYDINLSAGTYPISFNFSRRVTAITLYARFNMSDGSYKQADITSGAGEDLTPPAAINDLMSIYSDHELVTLIWTAPGDDGSTGLATSYEIRYSQNPINDTNWASATLFSSPPAPQIAGSIEFVDVTGLSPSTTYYFAIKTSDENNNISGLSNVVSESTTAIMQATYLQIDMSGAAVAIPPLNNRNVSNILLSNGGTSDILIRSIGGLWSSRSLRQIYINGVSVWSGSINSGGTATLTTPYTLTPSGGPYNLRLQFNNSFSGQTIYYLEFMMTDGSIQYSDSKSF